MLNFKIGLEFDLNYIFEMLNTQGEVPSELVLLPEKTEDKVLHLARHLKFNLRY